MITPEAPAATADRALTGSSLTTVHPPLAEGDGWRLLPVTRRVAGTLRMGVFAVLWSMITLPLAWDLARDASGLAALTLWLLGAGCAWIGFIAGRAAWRRLRRLLFTPVVELTLDAAELVRGRPAMLRWAVAGNRQGLLDLHLSLALVEECVHRRGSDVGHDRHTVREIPLDGGAGRGPQAMGTCAVVAPEDLPLSFAAESGQLLWGVRVRGSVSGGPGLDDFFPLRVVVADAGRAELVIGALPAGVVPAAGLTVVDGHPRAGVPFAGVVSVAGGDATLRLRWCTYGKGDSDGAEVASVVVPGGVAAFSMTLPALPPLHRGTVLTVTWTVEAEVAGVRVADLRFPETRTVRLRPA